MAEEEEAAAAAALRALPLQTRKKTPAFKVKTEVDDDDEVDELEADEDEEVDQLQDDDDDEVEEEGQEFDENHPFHQVSSSRSHQPTQRKSKQIFIDSDDEPDPPQQEEEETDIDDDQEDEWDEDPSLILNPRRWNVPSYAFQRFLTAYMGPPPSAPRITLDSSSDEEDERIPAAEDYASQSEGEMPTPGLEPSLEGEYSESSPLPPTSSPARSSSPAFMESSPFRGRHRRGVRITSPSATRSSSLASERSFSIPSAESSFVIPNAKYKHTPAPYKVVKVQRMRIERVERQFERSKKKGLRKLEKEERKEEEENEELERRKRELEEELEADDEEWDQLFDDPEV